jgi:hypothetical protein
VKYTKISLLNYEFSPYNFQGMNYLCKLRDTCIGFSLNPVQLFLCHNVFLPSHDTDKFKEEEKEVTAIFCKIDL